jgi:hypothetical protein
VAQVQAEQPKPNHIKTRNPKTRKPGQHHPINVMLLLLILE